MQVPVPDLEWIDYNRPVSFQSRELGSGWTGRIKRTGSSLDDRTQTVPVYVGLDKQGRADIINGLFTDVTIPGKVIENAYTIPHQQCMAPIRCI
jgi:multidrug efflux pump subunit AcrA (membrane-fusion protein)